MQEYPVLVPLSACYSGYEDRLSTRYSPVRHSTRNRSPVRVRLACVKHAASVRSEPGSNSPVQCLANHFDQTLVRSLKTNFLARSSCSVFKDQAPGSSPSQSPPFYPITKDLSNPFPLPQKLFPKTRDPRLTPGPNPRSSRAALIPHPSNTCQKISGQKITALLHPHNLIAKIRQNHNQACNWPAALTTLPHPAAANESFTFEA